MAASGEATQASAADGSPDRILRWAEWGMLAVAVGLVLAAGSLFHGGPSPAGSAGAAAHDAASDVVVTVGGRETTPPSAGGMDAATALTGTPRSLGPALRIDQSWLARTSQATGIPSRALAAYASAHLLLADEQPACGLGWNTLAAIGSVESDHGRHGGAVLGDGGYPDPAIRGIPLDGTASAAIPDTDGGTWDGDPVWDRAVGPLQFIPATWERWGSDGSGDGTADPNQIDDAAFAAARYLCASGPMTTTDGWRAAVFRYNHLDSYVDAVASIANWYAQAAPR
ncbi:MAG: lytic transglycosylase domain-containing protein [Microbacterium sp.]|uniref:lytic transglycosylase domain-containing protein n=1 Tax=Microbacterium sp. TaxID=51671 RepID=UPI003F803699